MTLMNKTVWIQETNLLNQKFPLYFLTNLILQEDDQSF